MSQNKAKKPQSSASSVEADAAALFKAMKGIGTDDKTLINIVTTRPRQHLVQVKAIYPKNHKNTLEQDIKGDTSGSYEKILLALISDRNEFFASELRNAVKGIGTNEHVLIEILCLHSSERIKKIIQAYKKVFNRDMVKDILDDLSGDTKSLFAAILECKRPATKNVDVAKAKADAKKLYDKGEGRLGTDEKEFINILTTNNKAEVEAIGKGYADLTGHNLQRAVKSETSGTFKKALLALITPEDEYYAEAIHNAIKGIGTNDSELVRIVGGLTKSQLKRVDAYFTHKYGKNLKTSIGADVSGNYGKVIVAAIPSQLP